jgi:phosphohistidine phosphatase
MLRHAKSAWQVDYGGEDRLRPLARRGRRAAKAAGRFLSSTGQVPDRALASPAVRAQETLDLASQAGRWDCAIEACEGLYGGPDEVLEAVRRHGRGAGLLMIVGHEPAWSAVASRLADGARFQLPTASLLRLDFDIEEWADLEGEGQIQWLVTPRLLEKNQDPTLRA